MFCRSNLSSAWSELLRDTSNAALIPSLRFMPFCYELKKAGRTEQVVKTIISEFGNRNGGDPATDSALACRHRAGSDSCVHQDFLNSYRAFIGP